MGGEKLSCPRGRPQWAPVRRAVFPCRCTPGPPCRVPVGTVLVSSGGWERSRGRPTLASGGQASAKLADHLFFSPPGAQGAEVSHGKHPGPLDGGTEAGAGLRAARRARGSPSPGVRPRSQRWGTGNGCGSAALEPRRGTEGSLPRSADGTGAPRGRGWWLQEAQDNWRPFCCNSADPLGSPACRGPSGSLLAGLRDNSLTCLPGTLSVSRDRQAGLTSLGQR